jgi:DNA polymerase-3 subunit delta'
LFERVLGQTKAKELLAQAIASGRLPHALLLVGPEGVGKRLLALELARQLLCFERRACGNCPGCVQVEARTHPELHIVQKIAERRGILLEQVHELQQALALRPLESAFPVAIIVDAHDLSLEAQDALLKTLEEPPRGSLLILVTHRPEMLRSTVRSRCQAVRCERLSVEDLRAAAARAELSVPADFPWSLARGQMKRLERLLGQDLLSVRSLLLELLTRGVALAPLTFAARLGGWAAAEREEAGGTRARERERLREALVLLLELARDGCLVQQGAAADSIWHSDLVPQLTAARDLGDPEVVDDLVTLVLESLDSLARNVDPTLVAEYLTLTWQSRHAAALGA